MDKSFLDGLNFQELEVLKYIITDESFEKKNLLNELDEKIFLKKSIFQRGIDFSSDRIPYYSKEKEEACLILLNEILVTDFFFLLESFAAKTVNRRPILIASKLNTFVRNNSTFSLIELEDLFKDLENIYYYEGVYNTFNYIKNYLYFLLTNNENVTKKEIFNDWKDKQKLVYEQLVEIANYLVSIRNGTELQLSIGNRGLMCATKKIVGVSNISSHDLRLINAVAFGTTIENLENKNYEASKRLLFLPRKGRKK